MTKTMIHTREPENTIEGLHIHINAQNGSNMQMVVSLGSCLYTRYTYSGTSFHCENLILHWLDMPENPKSHQNCWTGRVYMDNDLTEWIFGM